MASFPSNIEIRNVLPYWRSFSETVRLGEVAPLTNKISVPIVPITTYIHDWEVYHSVATGGDLLSAAIMNGQVELPIVKEVAKFMLEREDELSAHLKQVSQLVLFGKPKRTIPNLSIKSLLNNKDELIRKIRILKHYNAIYPRNPVAYIELASCYTLLGNTEKSKDMIEIALRLAPHQRFVSRSAARFFMHIDDKDRAYEVLAHNETVKNDPWILASEIAVSTANGKIPMHMKSGLNLLSADISPYELSELASAIGTVEMMHGNRKKARQAISMAIKAPNDNGFAQVTWWAKYYGENIDLIKKSGTPSLYEAQSIEALSQDQYQISLDASIQWLIQMPFSKRAALFASEVAYTYLKDYEVANSILKIGLQSSPQDPVLLNNLAYSCALQGNVVQAEQTLKTLLGVVRQNGDFREQVCYEATCGLTEYRKGNREDGAKLYQKAIMRAIENKADKLANLAMLNYIREDIQHNPSFDVSVLEHLDELVCADQKEAEQIKKDIRAIYEQKKL